MRWIRAFAVRFRQKRPDVNLYVTALSVKDLLGRFQSDTYRSDNRAGYQRVEGGPGVGMALAGVVEPREKAMAEALNGGV